MISAKKNNQENDVKFPSPPQDGISSISANGTQQIPTSMVIATSWDNTVNCYEIQSNQQGGVSNVIPQSQTKHDGPVLCSDINSQDNVTAYTGGADGSIRLWNVTQGATASQVCGRHDLGVRSVKYLADKNMLLSGSWDKTLKIWDLRQPNPTATMQLSDRVYAMDAKGQAVVVATADKQVHVFDLTAGNKLSEFKSPLAYQTRCVSIFHDKQGFALGCIEGRIALEHFNELQHKPRIAANPANKPADAKNFAFKCHRDGSDIFSVNAISFHTMNTFCSVGSDGVLLFWDKIARHRLAILDSLKRQTPITDCKINAMGTLMFYSCSYDWSRGAENNDPKIGNNIYAHQILPVEVTPKDPKTLKK